MRCWVLAGSPARVPTVLAIIVFLQDLAFKHKTMSSEQDRNAFKNQTPCLKQAPHPSLDEKDEQDAPHLRQACSAFQTCCRQESLPEGLSEGAALADPEALQWWSPAPVSIHSVAQCLPASVHACIIMMQSS